MTVFPGASASGGIGMAADEVKAGGYVKASEEGFKDAGLRATNEPRVTAKIGGVGPSVVCKSELFSVNFVPSVPEPERGPMLKRFKVSER